MKIIFYLEETFIISDIISKQKISENYQIFDVNYSIYDFRYNK